MAARRAILIGNGRYPEEKQLSPLVGPPNDVRYLAEVLENPEMGAFEIEQYIDVEHYRLLPNLEHRLAKARHDDTLLVYYSGHGKVDFRGQLCLTTLNTRLEALQTTSVPLPVLKSLIDSSPCKSILLMLDCCFSGAAAKAFVRSTVEDQLTLVQGAGLHILTSATSIETSLEREHEVSGEVLGDFTRCIVDGIRSGEADVDNDAEITVTEIRRYLRGRIRGQSPRYWGLETSGDLLIARNPAPKPAALPLPLLEAMENPLPSVREGAVHHLGELLGGSNLGLSLAARAALARLADDDSRRVSSAARELLDRYPRPEPGEPAAEPEPTASDLPDFLVAPPREVTPAPVEVAAEEEVVTEEVVTEEVEKEEPATATASAPAVEAGAG